LSDTALNENRLMVMDDDPDVGTFFGQVGEDLGFDVRVISEPANFAATVLEFSPTVLLLDLQMPGRDGIELLRELASLERNP
jgi:two-component system NtrC family response regulator